MILLASHLKLLRHSSPPVNFQVLLFYPQIDPDYSSLYSVLFGPSFDFIWTVILNCLHSLYLPICHLHDC